MKKPKDITINNICLLGADCMGVSTACVMAHMCPYLKIAIADLKPDRVGMWNTKQIPGVEIGLEEMMKKCQNNNLIFTTDTKVALRNSDLILLMLSPGPDGEGVCDMAEMEVLAEIIAETSKKAKIIVEKGSITPGNGKLLRQLLTINKFDPRKFEILANPDFYPEGEIMGGLLNPERILIGSEQTNSGLAAAEALASIYSNWVPREKIITMNTMASELTKVSTNAFLAQKLSNVGALSLMCECLGLNVLEIVKLVGGHKAITSKYMSPTFAYGGPHLQKDVYALTHMCEVLKLTSTTEYWKAVLDHNDWHMVNFKRKILSCFYNTLSRKKIGIWGIAYKKDSAVIAGSSALQLCRSLLEEGAKLSIYDPQVDKRQILEDLKGFTKDPEKSVMIIDDPYKAASKTHAIVLCTDWDEFKDLNFEIIYKDMLKPAYIFDGRNCLPHEKLTELGFLCKTVGTVVKY